MALQLRRKTHESIVYIDKDSAPRIMPNGEDFILEDIPIGTRVIYPNPPIKGLPNKEAAIRYAVNHPLEMEPLYALLEPGMRGQDLLICGGMPSEEGNRKSNDG